MTTHLLGTSLASRDAEQHQLLLLALLPVAKTLVNAVVTASLELDNVILLERGRRLVAPRLLHGLGDGVEEVLHVVLLLEHILGDEVVKVPELGGDEGLALGREPGDLLLGRLDVAGQVEVDLERGDDLGGGVDVADEAVAPAHDGDLLAVLEGLGVGLVHDELVGESDLLGADLLVLGVLGLLLLNGLGGGIGALDDDLDGVLLGDGGVTGSNGVDLLLVGSPEVGPVHRDDVARGALLEDEVAEGGDGHTAPADTTDGGHARIVPAPDLAGIDELGELALGEEGADEVHAGEIPHVDLAELEGINEPLVLGVAVGVLGGAESVGDALMAVDDGAGEIVHGVHLPLGAGTVMGGLDVAAVDDGVAQSLVGVVDGKLSADAVLKTLLGAVLHLLGEDAQVLFDAAVATARGNTLPALVAHGLLVGIIGVGVALLDHAHAHLVEVVEVVGSVGDGVGLDAHEGEILDDGILVLLLLLGRVGVVETEAQLALVSLVSKVVGKKGGLGVSDVKVTRGLRKETSDDALVGVLESERIAGTGLGGGGDLGLSGSILGLDVGLDLGVVLLDVSEPSVEVGERAALDEGDGGAVATESEPDLGVEVAKGVAVEVGAQDEVLVESLQAGLDCAEVRSEEGLERLELVQLHGDGWGICGIGLKLYKKTKHRKDLVTKQFP